MAKLCSAIKESNKFLTSIDLNDPIYLPYISFVKKTINLIESYIDDLMSDYNEELIILYLEETGILLNNIKSCIPFTMNK